MIDTEKLVAGLREKGDYAFECLRRLQEESAASDAVYPYLGAFAEMLEDTNSYIRTRGFLLIAANARWDTAHRIDAILDSLLSHITDDKPITARQCIGALPEIAREKPHLAGRIGSALAAADPAKYGDSMRPLVEKDIRLALERIRETAAARPCPCAQENAVILKKD